MNYHNVHMLLITDILNTYLFDISKKETEINQNLDCLIENKNVLNFEQMETLIDCDQLVLRNSINFINSEIIKVLQSFYGTNVESFKYYKSKKTLISDFGNDFETLKL
jgi:hypothetical protein